MREASLGFRWSYDLVSFRTLLSIDKRTQSFPLTHEMHVISLVIYRGEPTTTTILGQESDTSRRQLLARLPEAIAPDLRQYIPPKASILFYTYHHRLIPNVKALRLASRQLNTEIIDFLTNFSTKRFKTFLFVDVCGPPAQLHLNIGILINAASSSTSKSRVH